MGKSGLLGFLGLGRQRPLSLEEFRLRVVEEVQSRRADAALEIIGEDELAFGEARTSILRGYSYYREHPGELKLVLRQFGDLILYEPAPATPETLIVLVRPESFQAGNAGDDDRGLARPLPGGLIAVVAVDNPESYFFPSAGELRTALAMSDEEIWACATKNLRSRVALTPPSYRAGFVMGVKTDVGLASSLLIDDEFWAHPNLSSLGDLVVAPLERDELVVAPLAEPALVQALRNIVARRDSSGFLCDQLLLRKNGAWEEFQ